MRILVTGGLGFQGSHLSKALMDRGCYVTVLNTLSDTAHANIARFGLQSVKIVLGSVTDAEIIHKTVRHHDFVFHLAANVHVDESRERPLDYFQTNVIGTFNVAEACRRFDVPLFYASSCEVYGNQSGDLSESSPFCPASPYAASKAGAESLLFSYANTYGLPVLIARPGNVFGFGQRGGNRGAVIPRFAERAMTGKEVVIYGTGQQRRDYVYIKDLVRAYLHLLERREESPSIWNVGRGEQVSVREIAGKVIDFLGSCSPIRNGEERPGEVRQFAINSSKLLETGFKWKWNFDTGLHHYLSRISHTHV